MRAPPRLRPAVVLLLSAILGCAAKSPGTERPEPLAPDGPVLQVAAGPLLAIAAPNEARPSTLAPLRARVQVGERAELPLERMDVRVRVDGFRARVLVDVEFTNPGEAVLEGTFQVRLPDDASPYFLAFGPTSGSIGASPPPLVASADAFAPAQIVAERAGEGIALKEARVVPRSAGARAYTDTVRPRQVRVITDPALAEWAGAGVFNTRVFPLTGRTRHRVTIGYDVDLTPVGADLELRLPIPREVPALRVAVDAHAPTPGDVVVEPRLPATREGPRLRVQASDPRFEALVVRLVDRGTTWLEGHDPETGPHFAARLTPALPPGPAVASRPRAVLLVDTSLSSGPRADTWRALARELLGRNRDELREFAVLFFNVEARWWRPGFVANTPENVDAALAAHAELALEGATDLSAALAQAQAPAWAPADAAGWDLFLLSDGAATWGEGDAFALARRLRGRPGALHAYRTHGAGVDPRFLGVLTRETGGALYSVASEAEVATVATAHRRRPWQLVGVEVPGAEDLLVAGRPQTLAPGQSLLLAGRGALKAGARVGLKVRQGEQERTISAALGAPIASELTPRIYGQVAVEQLEESLAALRVEAESYARHYRVPGAASSLLMLESEADYARMGLAGHGSGASLVLSRPVERALADSAALVNAGRVSAQAELLHALTAAPTTTGLNLALDQRVAPTLQAAAPEAFELAWTPVPTRSSAWREVPAVLRPQLAELRPDPVLLVADAEQRRVRLGAGDGLKALSSLIEVRPGDDALLRELAMTALAWGEPASAYPLLRRAAALPAHDPEVHHLLGVTFAELGRIELAIAHFELALASGWDLRFQAGASAVILDYLRLLARADLAARPEVASFMRARADELRGRIAGGARLVVQLQWSSDDTDLDLHVQEPDGTDCAYGNRRTPAGGELSVDATEGRGPELYVHRRPSPGIYTIGVKYFSGERHRVDARTRALVTVYADLGLPGERVTRHVVTLEPGKAVVPVTLVEVR